MKNTIPILTDKLFVLQVKTAYEVIIEFIELHLDKSLSIDERMMIIDDIGRLEDKYRLELDSLKILVNKKAGKQLDIEDSIEQIKSSTI